MILASPQPIQPHGPLFRTQGPVDVHTDPCPTVPEDDDGDDPIDEPSDDGPLGPEDPMPDDEGYPDFCRGRGLSTLA